MNIHGDYDVSCKPRISMRNFDRNNPCFSCESQVSNPGVQVAIAIPTTKESMYCKEICDVSDEMTQNEACITCRKEFAVIQTYFKLLWYSFPMYVYNTFSYV